MSDDLVIAGKHFKSRLIVGTGRYRTMEDMVQALDASGTELVTVAIRRLDLDNPNEKTILDYIDWDRYSILPNTAGCQTVAEALFVAKLGREVTKTNAWQLQTFETRGYGALGVTTRDRVVYYRRSERRHTAASEFNVQEIQRLPRVDIVMAYQGASGDLIRAAVDHGAEGIVIAAAGAGSMSGEQRDAITYAYEHDVLVVVTTRTGSGRIAPPRPAPEDEESAPDTPTRLRVSGEDLAPLKACVLLMLGLTVTHELDEIQRMFSEY